MKFGKRLKQQIQETLPEWLNKFLSYKELKKLVRLISSPPALLNGSLEYGNAEAEFVCLLNNEIEKFNSFFIEMEEDFVIRYKQRIERVQETWGEKGSHPSKIYYREEMARIRNDIVNFHGEMVLLINYSNINYTGLAKILKKYDKRTGSVLRLPFIQTVLEQPFFTIDLLSKLIKELESTIDAMFPSDAGNEEHNTKGRENQELTIVGEAIFRNTVAALLTMQEIGRGSSTYSSFSLAPLSLAEFELHHSIQVSSSIPII